MSSESNKIKVVLCAPGEIAKIIELDNELEALQATVNGYIEMVPCLSGNLTIVCNEEAKLNGEVPNRALIYRERIIDIIHGTFFVCGREDGELISLTDQDVASVLKVYEKPQAFVYDAQGKMQIVKYVPSQKKK